MLSEFISDRKGYLAVVECQFRIGSRQRLFGIGTEGIVFGRLMLIDVCKICIKSMASVSDSGRDVIGVIVKSIACYCARGRNVDHVLLNFRSDRRTGVVVTETDRELRNYAIFGSDAECARVLVDFADHAVGISNRIVVIASFE